jgi:PleD family two-component response regulator
LKIFCAFSAFLCGELLPAVLHRRRAESAEFTVEKTEPRSYRTDNLLSSVAVLVQVRSFHLEIFRKQAGSLHETSPSTILVVEDVEEIRSHMNAMLAQKGHRVLNASNAEEAIRIAKADRPSLILTDLDLPTFSLLLQKVGEHDHLDRIPVVVVDIEQVEIKDRDVEVLSDFDQLDEMVRGLAEPAV